MNTKKECGRCETEYEGTTEQYSRGECGSGLITAEWVKLADGQVVCFRCGCELGLVPEESEA
jgi:hypothetical protein